MYLFLALTLNFALHVSYFKADRSDIVIGHEYTAVLITNDAIQFRLNAYYSFFSRRIDKRNSSFVFLSSVCIDVYLFLTGPLGPSLEFDKFKAVCDATPISTAYCAIRSPFGFV